MINIKLIKYAFSIHNYMKTYLPQNVSRYHGRLRIDQYSDLKDNKKLINQFQQKSIKQYQNQSHKWKHITEQYYSIVSQRYDPRNKSIPQAFDNYQYYTKVQWVNQKQYNAIYRKQNGQQGQELVLDIMKIPKIKKYWKTAQLVKSCFNSDHSVIGFGVDLHNNQNIKFMFRDIKSGKILQQSFNGGEVKNIAFNDNSSIFYLVENEVKRPYRVYFKKLGSNQQTLIYEQKNQQFYLDFHTSKDKQYLIINSSNKINSQIICIKKNNKYSFNLLNIFPKSLKSRAFANISSQTFYLWNDLDKAYDYKVSKYNIHTRQYTDYFIPQKGYVLTQVDIFQKFMVLYLRKVSKSIIKIINLQNNQNWQLNLNQDVCTIQPGMNQGYNSKSFYFYLSTPFIYNVCFKYSFQTKTLIQMDQYNLQGPKFDKNKYKSYIIQAPSETTDYIPITIIAPKKRDGPSKFLLHVYGFYGIENEVSYNNTYLVALQKGWTIGFAHVRGGKQKGKQWWNQAIQERKSRTWKDLHQCVAYLLKEGYTHPALLVLHGGSAGAITVWNSINQFPYLYKAAVLLYPFLDVLTSLLDQKLALSISDRSQFGNPQQKLQTYNLIESYCPYETIKNQEYPGLFIQAAKNDYRCQLYQVIKFCKRFRTRAKNPRKIEQIGEKGLLLSIQENASHEGVSDIKQNIRNTCQMFGYLDYLLIQGNKQVTYQ